MRRRFGKLLRGERERSGKTMGDLARFLGVSVPYISDVEHGNRSPLTNERILRAAEFLGIDDPRPLLLAAGQDRGSFDLDAATVSPKAREVGATLMRSWSDLSEEQLDEIARVLNGAERDR